MVTNEIIDYERLADAFNQALIHTLRKHSIADTFLDYWVPDADPVVGIAGMADSARIAGHAEIAIRFHRSTVPETRLLELRDAIGRFSRVSLEQHGDSVVVHATGMISHGDVSATRVTGHKERRSAYWQPSQLSPEAFAKTAASEPLGSCDLSEFADVHSHLRESLKAALGRLCREGDRAPEDRRLVRVEGEADGVKLMLDVFPGSHTVRHAHHMGATRPSERAALDLFCRAAENLPLQEVADHVGLKVIDSLVDEDKLPPVKGILLPANAGAAFTLGPRLTRRAYDTYLASTGVAREANFYYAPPSPSWLALSPAKQRESVVDVIRGFLQSEGHYPDDIVLLRLEKNKYGYHLRAVVGFSERAKSQDKPSLMRRLEKRLRRDAEQEIELVADRAKDASPLRRLS